MGGFEQKYSRWIGEDAEFTRRFAALNSARFVIDPLPTWKYRRHLNNYSAMQWRNIRARARIIDEHLRNKTVPEHLIDTATTSVQGALASSFDIAYWERQYKAAIELFGELPPQHRNIRRLGRYFLSHVHTLWDSNH